jgi:hypothetical protein
MLTSLKSQIVFSRGDTEMLFSISRKARSSSRSCPNKAKKPLLRLWSVVHVGKFLYRRTDCLCGDRPLMALINLRTVCLE